MAASGRSVEGGSNLRHMKKILAISLLSVMASIVWTPGIAAQPSVPVYGYGAAGPLSRAAALEATRIDESEPVPAETQWARVIGLPPGTGVTLVAGGALGGTGGLVIGLATANGIAA